MHNHKNYVDFTHRWKKNKKNRKALEKEGREKILSFYSKQRSQLKERIKANKNRLTERRKKIEFRQSKPVFE